MNSEVGRDSIRVPSGDKRANMIIILPCSVIGFSLLILVLYQMNIGNVADGSQLGASIALLVFSLVARSLGSTIEMDESSMRLVGPGEPIPEEAYCTMCGKNMLETRNDDGGAMVCPHPDCEHWYHKDHFYNMASGRCQSPQCRKRQ